MESYGSHRATSAPKMKSDKGDRAAGALKMESYGSHRVAGALQMKSDGSNRAMGATLGMCFPTFFLSSFLSLMKEKRAKENQAPTGGGEVGRVQEGADVVFSEVCRVQERACVVFSGGGG